MDFRESLTLAMLQSGLNTLYDSFAEKESSSTRRLWLSSVGSGQDYIFTSPAVSQKAVHHPMEMFQDRTWFHFGDPLKNH
jgi:hypothetical protein